MRKIHEREEPWDVQKIILSLFVFIGIIIGGIYIKQSLFDHETTRIKGAKVQLKDKEETSSTEEKESPNISYPNLQNEFQKKLNQVQNEIEGLSLGEIASSSPQVRKILKDVESLQEYPANQARQMCENICRSF